jgi:hypothetical protein
MKELLILIHPQWVKLIESGQKTIEVRKSWPKDFNGTVWVYESLRYGGGVMVVLKFTAGIPVELLQSEFTQWSDFYSYFDGGVRKIPILNYTTITPIPISEMFSGKKVLQNYAWVNCD